MAKETVRYPDELVAQIETVVADSDAFESKSEYHRFASEFLLTLLNPEHSPSVLGYGDILAELEADLPAPDTRRGDPTADAGVPFMEAYVHVRRHLLRADQTAAQAYIDDAYGVADPEALLLEELVAVYGDRSVSDAPSTSPSGPVSDAADAHPQSNGSDSAGTAAERPGIAPRAPGDETADETDHSRRDDVGSTVDESEAGPAELSAPDQPSD